MKIKVTHVPPILDPKSKSGQVWGEEMLKARDQIGGVYRTATIMAIKGTKPFAPIGESGNLINGIGTTVTGPKSIRVVPSPVTNPYAVVQELGRRPRQPGPPLAPILAWVKYKFGVSGKEADSIAFLVRRKLHNKGMKGRFFFRRTRRDIKARKLSESLVRAAIRRWAKRVA